MANRFTDTGKWDKRWYRELGSKLRDIRSYILDRCDHAGVIELDLKTFEHFIGEPVTMVDIDQALRGNFDVVDDKIFARDFIEFQYKVPVEKLNPANKVHSSVLQRLENLNLIKGLTSPLQGAKDTEKDKEQDKDKEKEKSELVQKVLKSIPIFTTDQLGQKYPHKFQATVDACVLYHSNDQASVTWSGHKWGQKLTAWFLEDERRAARGQPTQENPANYDWEAITGQKAAK